MQLILLYNYLTEANKNIFFHYKNGKSHLSDFSFFQIIMYLLDINHKLEFGINSILALERISAAKQ